MSTLLDGAWDAAVTRVGEAYTDSYARAYPHIVELQMLSELQRFWQMSHESQTIINLFTVYDEHLELTRPDFPVREPILSLRVQLLNFLSPDLIIKEVCGITV